jgi:hypothetical protein
VRGCAGVVRVGGQPPLKTEEAEMSGQLALVVSEEEVAPAAVWETLSLALQEQLALRLARLLARLLEAARDE